MCLNLLIPYYKIAITYNVSLPVSAASVWLKENFFHKYMFIEVCCLLQLPVKTVSDEIMLDMRHKYTKYLIFSSWR